jgi:hypothetical protein
VALVTEPPANDIDYEVVCPHCHKEFRSELISGDALRYQGFKSPHCKLFVPFRRAAETA